MSPMFFVVMFLALVFAIVAWLLVRARYRNERRARMVAEANAIEQERRAEFAERSRRAIEDARAIAATRLHYINERSKPSPAPAVPVDHIARLNAVRKDQEEGRRMKLKRERDDEERKRRDNDFTHDFGTGAIIGSTPWPSSPVDDEPRSHGFNSGGGGDFSGAGASGSWSSDSGSSSSSSSSSDSGSSSSSSDSGSSSSSSD